jgi:hypothetical protein
MTNQADTKKSINYYEETQLPRDLNILIYGQVVK